MKKERIQSLDILRTIALVLICVYHWFSYKGTYIGVVIFFALSGYLVTSGLLSKDFSIFTVIDKRLRKVYLGDISELELTVFVDNSSVEVFINGGQEVFSSRIFPEKGADGISVFTDGDVSAEIEKWEWK